ncbi:MAG: hypothetical protein IH862_01575 [Chloroflexi bacterium]|nr:hypothetical protein [Chloroflexota bacterium]
MPNKAHRAASRQAQVKRRRRHGKTRPQEFDAGPDESTVVATVVEPVVEDDVEPESVAQRAPARAAQGPARRSRSGAVAESPPGQKFLAGELRQIGMIATMIVVVLAVLTVFLRG